MGKSGLAPIRKRENTSKGRLAAFAAMGALAAALAGCASEAEREKLASLPCPSVGILADTETLTVYEGNGRDITDVVVSAEIEEAVTACEYDLDDGIIYVDIAFRGTADLGPAATSRQVKVPVFIALTETSSRVLRKEVRELTLSFGGASRKVGFVHSIEETKVPYVPPFDGSAYEMLVGFQLTKDQLEANRTEGR